MVISLVMKSLIRLLALWLMLGALPFQGIASASMLRCGAIAPAVQADRDGPQAIQAAGDDAEHCSANPHGEMKGGCCVAAGLVHALPQPAALHRRAERLHPPEPAAPAPVDLALPKRPPRAIPA